VLVHPAQDCAEKDKERKELLDCRGYRQQQRTHPHPVLGRQAREGSHSLEPPLYGSLKVRRELGLFNLRSRQNIQTTRIKMTYKTDTNRNADLAEAIVKADLLQRGWIVLVPSSRDSPYDFVVDIGGRFERVQVKKMTNATIHRIVERGNQKVTKNGKIRNSIDYARRGIEWIVGVDIDSQKTHYYHIDTYSKKPKSFSTNKHTQDGFPINESIKKNTDY